MDIYSKSHLVVSLVVAAAAVTALGFDPVTGLVLVLAGGVLGVAIDFDHFFVARLRTGSWDAVARVVRSPRIAFADQAAIFDDGTVGKIPRLLSHVLIAGPFVAGVALFNWRFGLVAAVVLYFHLLGDLLADTRDLIREGTL